MQFQSNFSFGTNISQNVSNTQMVAQNILPPSTITQSNQPGSINYSSPLEAPLHDIFKQSVEEFKKYWKDQKAMRDEISQFSDKPLYTINTDIKNIQSNLSQLSLKIVKTGSETKRLKEKILQEVKQVEYSSRIKESSNIYNTFNVPDFEYFNGLITEFQDQLQTLTQNLKDVKLSLDANQTQSFQGIADSRALVQISKYLQESIIYVASNLQTIHEIIQSYKIGGIGFYKPIIPVDFWPLKVNPVPPLEKLQHHGTNFLLPHQSTGSPLFTTPNLPNVTNLNNQKINDGPKRAPCDLDFVDRGKNYYTSLLQNPNPLINQMSPYLMRSDPAISPTSPNLKGIIKRPTFSPPRR